MQDVNDLMHDVLLVLWGRSKQADWGGGQHSISKCGDEYHRMVLMGGERSKRHGSPKLSHVRGDGTLDDTQCEPWEPVWWNIGIKYCG